MKQPYPRLSRWLAPPMCDDPARLARAVEGKTWLLTGASFGIGAALARRLGAAGANLLLAARSRPELEAICEEIRGAGGKALALPLDLAQPEQVDAVIEQVLQASPRLDGVIHNAGKSIRRPLLESLDRPHDYQRCMNVNYLGPVRLQLGLLPRLLSQGEGHIISVSTLGIRLPRAAHWAAYLASKEAFDHWLSAAVPELRPRGICCSSVYMGLVHTRMSAPTRAYAALPGMTPDQAAAVVCYALVHRSRRVGPWWLGPIHWLSGPLERPAEWLQTRFLGRGL